MNLFRKMTYWLRGKRAPKLDLASIFAEADALRNARRDQPPPYRGHVPPRPLPPPAPNPSPCSSPTTRRSAAQQRSRPRAWRLTRLRACGRQAT